jgi:hypothetical protein
MASRADTDVLRDADGLIFMRLGRGRKGMIMSKRYDHAGETFGRWTASEMAGASPVVALRVTQ